MGQVYRARDTKLDRDVAIKVLPAGVTHDADRLARFQREARTLASLNHPNIAIIHGLEQAGDVHALVMELVEGDDLSQRIARGAIPMDEALPIAKHIAEALEAAHEQGIVHRDLKPANIKVRSDGTVKVLDFGLAKAMDPTAAMSAGHSMSPTITTPAMTQAGMLLGTAAYMSPEQAKGRLADRRSDVWAFGCVLYEMLTGRRPFDGEDVSDTIAAILKDEPVWGALPFDTPDPIRTLLERCLRKDVRRRLPNIGAARIEIEEASSRSGSRAHLNTPAVSGGPTYRWPFVALLSLLVAIGLAIRIMRTPAQETRIVSFDVTGWRGADIDVGHPLSPDGRWVTFTANSGGKRSIWVRALDSAVAQPLPGTDVTEAGRPVWSADSRYIAFFADGKLKKVAVTGGPPSVICSEPGRDVSWSSENVILIGGQGTALLRVSAAGGQPTPATELGANETTHDYPEFLPDGRHFLYLARHGREPADWDLFVGSLDSKERRLLPGIHAGARYSPTGHLLFLRDGTLMAQPFDLARLDIFADASPVAERVYVGPRTPFSVSMNGTLAYLNAALRRDSRLAWFDRTGKEGTAVAPMGDYDGTVRLSPDGKQVAFARGEGLDQDVFLLDVEKGTTSRFTSSVGADFAPVWSPDGRIGFASSRDGVGNVAVSNPNGANLYERAVGVVGQDKALLKTDAGKIPTDWSRDGRYLAYTLRNDVWALPLSVPGNAEPLRVTDTAFVESHARFSPDGRWIAYQSNESGTQGDVYIQSFPAPGVKQQVSTKGGILPRWGANGTELFYVTPTSTLMSVSVKSAGAGLQVAIPVPLFSLPAFQIGGDYDVSVDGRFLMHLMDTEQAPLSMTVILNWARRLKQ